MQTRHPFDSIPIPPPIPDIRARLAHNQRERHRLRTLLRWALDDQRYASHEAAPEDRQHPRGTEAGHA